MRRVFGWYGAGPLHLVALLAAFALAGYAAARFVPANPVGVAVWFAGAIVGHDLILLPLYSIADRSVFAVLRHRSPDRPGLRRIGLWRNHVRVPAVLSGVLFLVFFPLILGLAPNFAGVTARTTDPYLGRWLLVTGILFAGSALVLALRVRRRSPIDEQQMLQKEGGQGLDGKPRPGPRQQRTGGDEPEREG